MSPGAIGVISTEQRKGSGAYIALENLISGWYYEPSRIKIIAPDSSCIGVLAKERNLGFVALPAGKDSFLQNIRGIRSVLPKLADCSCIHAWHSRGFELAWLAGNRIGVPALGTLHDHPLSSLLGKKRRLVMKIAAKKLGRLACVSHAVRSAWGDIIKEDFLSVIHNGLSDCQTTRSPGDVVRVGFLGMYSPIKGFDIVRDWIRNLPVRNIEWRLYGDIVPEWRWKAQELANDSQLRVVLCGNRRTEEIFSEIDVLVQASVEFETFGMVLVEAARAGIPSIASGIGAAGEIIIEDETGYIFDPLARPRDGMACLVRLVQDGSLRLRMGQAARKRYETYFSVERMVNKYAEFWGITGSKN